jgi:hypothetical protein
VLSPIADGGKNAPFPGSHYAATRLGGQKVLFQLIMAKAQHESPRTAMRCAEMRVLLNAVLDCLPGCGSIRMPMIRASTGRYSGRPRTCPFGSIPPEPAPGVTI